MSLASVVSDLASERPFALTDAGNAERFAAQHRDRARFVGAWKAWLVFDGRRWRRDDRGEVLLLAKATARSIDAEVAASTRDDDRKKVRVHAGKSESRAGLENMVALARSECGAAPEDFDGDPWLLNVQNGTLDLRSGELRPHRADDMITKLAAVAYEPDASAPTWTAFLDRVMAGNARMIEHLQRLVGYALVGVPSEHVIAFSYGAGANGKSVFHNAVFGMLGDYASKAPRGLLYESRNDRHPAELVPLCGARFVLAPETKAGQRFDEALIKDLTSEEPIAARGMNENFWTFEPSHTLFLCGNHKPTINGGDEGIWRRMLLIPWTVTIPEAERDKSLAAKLEAERAGILAWAVRGCLAWQRDGLARPPEVAEATAAYRDESNPLHDFLAARCVLEPDARIPRRALRAAYEAWAKDEGAVPIGARRFADALRVKGISDGGTMRVRPGHAPVDAWRGVRLIAEETNEAARDLAASGML